MAEKRLEFDTKRALAANVADVEDDLANAPSRPVSKTIGYL